MSRDYKNPYKFTTHANTPLTDYNLKTHNYLIRLGNIEINPNSHWHEGRGHVASDAIIDLLKKTQKRAFRRLVKKKKDFHVTVALNTPENRHKNGVPIMVLTHSLELKKDEKPAPFLIIQTLPKNIIRKYEVQTIGEAQTLIEALARVEDHVGKSISRCYKVFTYKKDNTMEEWKTLSRKTLTELIINTQAHKNYNLQVQEHISGIKAKG